MLFWTVLRKVLAALLALLALAALVATAADVAAGPAHATTARPALTSVITGPRYFTHYLSTVVDPYPDTDPTSPTRTPIECEHEPVLIDTGAYTFGTSYANDGNSYDRDNVFLHGGIYQWTDCLFPSPHGGYLQLARLHPAWLPDDGTHNAAIITHPRNAPLPIDTDDQGRTRWGSFLSRDE